MKRIKNWAIATFVLCFLVILAGGVVRTTQSGMGCPDWPKCFGKWIPPVSADELPPDFEKYLRQQDIDHTFNVWHTWIEYFNRLLGTLLGLFAIIQVMLLWSRRKELVKAFRLAIAFLITVILTGLFGAIVVKLNLAHVSISVHLLFALLLVQIQLALILSLKNKLSVIPASGAVQKWVFAFLCIVLIQSVLGTMVRMHVDDISKSLGYELRHLWLNENHAPSTFYIHRSLSWLVLVGSIFIAWKYKGDQLLRNKFFVLLFFVFLNMIAGITLAYADMPRMAQPIHLLLATFAITQTVSILLQLKNDK